MLMAGGGALLRAIREGGVMLSLGYNMEATSLPVPGSL